MVTEPSWLISPTGIMWTWFVTEKLLSPMFPRLSPGKVAIDAVKPYRAGVTLVVFQ